MRDVSCRIFSVLLDEMQRRGLPEQRLIEGTPYPLSHYRNVHEHVEWSVGVQVMTNARQFFSHEDFFALGKSFVRSPLLRSLTLVGSLLFSAKSYFRWLATDPKSSAFQLSTCLEASFKEVGPEHVIVELRTAAGQPTSAEIFHFIHGAFSELPQAFGVRKSSVVLTELAGGARYELYLPERVGLLGRLRRLAVWPWALHGAAVELKKANELLTARYRDLEIARAALSRHAACLHTAHQIGQLIHGDLDLDRTVSAVTQAMVEHGRFAAAELVLNAEIEGRIVERRSSWRKHTTMREPITAALESRSRSIGILRVWVDDNDDLAERGELLGHLIPTIALAVTNALVYTALSDYRDNLEARVAERTRELVAARDDLSASVTQMRELYAARERIFANVNHEIRTPLSLIMLAASAIERRMGKPLEERMGRDLISINGSVRQLLRLIDGLLLLAAGQEDKLKLRPVPCDLAMALDRMVHTWLPAAEARHLQLTYQGPSRCGAVLDEGAVDRMLSNLLSNAIKFTPSGGSITVRLAEEGLRLRILVQDTGIGIEPEFRERIFRRFEQGQLAVHPGARGSGLGLSLVKQLCEAHGGTISLHNPVAGGSVFCLDLPRRPAASVAAREDAMASGEVLGFTPDDFGQQPSDASSVDVVEAERSPRATLLVAEDDPELRLAIARSLAGEYRLLLASSGTSALQLARSHSPDLLITDIGMPGMDGLELTRRFRELPGQRLAPVIVLTAYGSIDDRLSGFAAGAIDYIIKPFVVEELKARIRSLLELRELALRLHQSEKMATLGILSAGLAHELRNPANALVNALPPLRAMLPKAVLEPQSASARLLDVIEGCAAQIGIVAKQLLGYQRSGELMRTEQPFAQVLTRALAIAQPVLQGITVHKECTYLGPLSCAVPFIVQALVNLLENGAHAAGPGGWVRIANRLEGERLIIEVSDSGPGVPPALRERIFEPFFTTKPPGAGTGLGLTTSRDIVARHGGRLDVREQGAGSAFCIELPLGTGRSPSAAERAAEQNQGGADRTDQPQLQ